MAAYVLIRVACMHMDSGWLYLLSLEARTTAVRGPIVAASCFAARKDISAIGSHRTTVCTVADVLECVLEVGAGVALIDGGHGDALSLCCFCSGLRLHDRQLLLQPADRVGQTIEPSVEKLLAS